MYEFYRERQLAGPSTFEAYNDDVDYDYDVYFLWTSTRPNLISPWDSVDVFELPSPPEPQQENQYCSAASFLPPLSPTYSIASDFVFPDVGHGSQMIGKFGYSRLFVNGFISATQQIAKRLDGLLRKVRDQLRPSARIS